MEPSNAESKDIWKVMVSLMNKLRVTTTECLWYLRYQISDID